jgi:riboflavin synthase
MFTGIVVEVGEVLAPPPALRLRAPGVAADAAIGDSVAIEGCCLTVTAVSGDELEFRAVPETLRRTMLGDLRPGDGVNLEPALRVGDRMAGHWVQGHVDAVGSVRAFEPDGEARTLTVDAPDAVLRTTIVKGSVCVGGVSLTVTAVDAAGFAVSLIPHTLAVTTLGRLAPGRRVNLEADVLGRYVERLLASGTLSA